jgi:mannan endo-1,4-beta-mannosidase
MTKETAMKSLISIFVAVIVAATTVMAQPTDGLVLHWDLNGNAMDRSGSGHNGQIVGGTYRVPDHFGDPLGAMHFDHSSYITSSWLAIGGSAPRTFSVWLRTTDVGHQEIFSYGDANQQAGGGFYFGLNRCDYQGMYGDVYAGWLLHPATTSDGTWHHFAVVVPDVANPTLNQIEMFCDGVLVPNTACTDFGNPILNTVLSPTRPFEFNRWFGLSEFTGDADEIRVYNRALSALEIQSLQVPLQLTFPNGNEHFQVGQTIPIQWMSNVNGNVNINLLRNGQIVHNIVFSTSNTGSFSWAIPTDLEPSSYYKVDIRSTLNSYIVDGSDYCFRIQEISHPQPTAFVGVNEAQLSLDNHPFDYVGTNCYYLMTVQANGNSHPGASEVDRVFEIARDRDLRVIRTMAFDDGQNGLQTAPLQYNDAYMIALDNVIAKAGNHGIKLILPLVNYWCAYGGMWQYIHWYNSNLQCPPVGTWTHPGIFYNTPQIKQWYQAYLSFIVNRVNSITHITYKNDPTILAWELANEPRPADADDVNDPLYAWIDEMAAYLRQQDSNHLIGVGADGNYGSSGPSHELAYFERICSSSYIDFCTQHLYVDADQLNLPSISEVRSFITSRSVDSWFHLGKPFLLEEFGINRNMNDPQGHNRADYYQAILDQLYASGGSGSNFWVLFPGNRDSWSGWDSDNKGVFELDDIALLDQVASTRPNPPVVVYWLENGILQLAWQSVQGASTYRVEVADTPDGDYQTITTTTLTTWPIVIGPQHKQFYRVIAVR